jgi:hypothetical protein
VNWIEDHNKALRPKLEKVLPSEYRPELYDSPYCDEEESDYYQQHVGVLRWPVELEQIIKVTTRYTQNTYLK